MGEYEDLYTPEHLPGKGLQGLPVPAYNSLGQVLGGLNSQNFGTRGPIVNNSGINNAINYKDGKLTSQRQAFTDWILNISKNDPDALGGLFPFNLPNFRQEDYDYGLAFKADPSAQGGHLGDVGKLPNHPTFSNESAYGLNNPTAGKWIQPVGGQDANSNDWRYHNPSRGLFWAPEQQAYSSQYARPQPLQMALSGLNNGR